MRHNNVVVCGDTCDQLSRHTREEPTAMWMCEFNLNDEYRITVDTIDLMLLWKCHNKKSTVDKCM